MKSSLAAIILALVAGLVGAASHAATILPTENTTVLVTAPLAALGLGGAPTGSATVTTTGDFPLFSFGITGGSVDKSGNALIEHDGSGVKLFALANPSVSASVGNFLVNTLAGTVSGIVNGAGPSVVLFNFSEVTPKGIALNISSTLAGALKGVFGAPDLTGARFGFANTAPQVAPVPIPAPFALLLGAVGGLAVIRRARTPSKGASDKLPVPA
jgi:hypothetical protein